MIFIIYNIHILTNFDYIFKYLQTKVKSSWLFYLKIFEMNSNFFFFLILKSKHYHNYATVDSLFSLIKLNERQTHLKACDINYF